MKLRFVKFQLELDEMDFVCHINVRPAAVRNCSNGKFVQERGQLSDASADFL